MSQFEVMENIPTLYEWAGGMPVFEKLTALFYDKVLRAELLEPVFRHMSKEHQLHVAHFLAEVIGGPPFYSTNEGSHFRMIRQHIGKHLTEQHRKQWLKLLIETAVIAAEYVVVPMAADLFSLQGLKNLGNQLGIWKDEWADRASRNPEPSLALPKGNIKPLGYVVMQHGIKESRPVKSYLKWLNRIPSVFREYVFKNPAQKELAIGDDRYCLSLLKHYHSLIPMAMEARRPIFLLKPADGAIGAHLGAVRSSYNDFRTLTDKILEGIMMS